MKSCKDCLFYQNECESEFQQKLLGNTPTLEICEIFQEKMTSKEKFLQAVKETICVLDGHKYDGGDIREDHLDELTTTCFTFKCSRCNKYVTYAIKDSDLSHTYPLEMELDFNGRKN